MHPSVMEFVEEVVPPEAVRGLRVLEVGSYNVNGTVREMLQPLSASYTGIDIREGPGVDVVMDASDAPSLGLFDLVISTEMMEHAKDWRSALRGMVQATRIGGMLVLTMRGPGAGRHDHPGDYWRFTPWGLTRALNCLGVASIPRWDHGLGYTDGVFTVGIRSSDIDYLQGVPDPERAPRS